jgi:uncharacterized protein
MTGGTDAKTIRKVDRAECLQLLRERTLGRIASDIAGDIVILPVYYALVDGEIVFRSATGTKLDAAVLKTRVAFEVDNGNPAWSVLVRGHAEEIRDAERQVRARARLGNDWPAGDRERLISIPIEDVSGRRLVPAG